MSTQQHFASSILIIITHFLIFFVVWFIKCLSFIKFTLILFLYLTSILLILILLEWVSSYSNYLVVSFWFLHEPVLVHIVILKPFLFMGPELSMLLSPSIIHYIESNDC